MATLRSNEGSTQKCAQNITASGRRAGTYILLQPGVIRIRGQAGNSRLEREPLVGGFAREGLLRRGNFSDGSGEFTSPSAGLCSFLLPSACLEPGELGPFRDILQAARLGDARKRRAESIHQGRCQVRRWPSAIVRNRARENHSTSIRRCYTIISTYRLARITGIVVYY
jgi:hypothetical protein